MNKLAGIWNVWDGDEHLRRSIELIKPHLDVVIVDIVRASAELTKWHVWHVFYIPFYFLAISSNLDSV